MFTFIFLKLVKTMYLADISSLQFTSKRAFSQTEVIT